MFSIFRVFYLAAVTTVIFLLSIPSYALEIPCTLKGVGLPNTVTIPSAPGTWIEVTFNGIYIDTDDYSKRYGLITTTKIMAQSKLVIDGFKKSISDRKIFSSVGSYRVEATCSGGKAIEMNPGDTVSCGENQLVLIELYRPTCATKADDIKGIFTVNTHTKSSLVDEDIKITVPMPLDVGVKDKLLDSKGSALLTGGILGSDGQLL